MASELNYQNWKEFKLTGENGLFQSAHGTRITKADSIEGNIPLITAGNMNNGVNRYIQKPKKNTIFENSITIDMFGSVFYQNQKFVCDDNIYPIFPIKNEFVGLFLVPIIKKQLNNSFAEQFRQKTLEKIKIKLPVDNQGNPDWQFMEDYMKQLEEPLLKKIKKCVPQLKPIDSSSWREFIVKDIFEDKKYKKYSKIPNDGNIPFITCTSINNGVSKYCNLEANQENAITVSTNGACFDCFWHSGKFCASSDVEVLYCKNHILTDKQALFLCACLQQNKGLYDFANKPKNGKVWNTKIKLPAVQKEDGTFEPDWKFMEEYMKGN